MSMLRMLSPLRGGPSSSPARKNEEIKVKTMVPSHGSVFMNPPNDPLWPHGRSDGPREDQLLHGLVDISVPSGARRRCKSVRVGFRSTARLNMGPTRGWEEDIVFERKVEMLGGNADGILLDEGVQRFEFTLILPSTLPAHDWHNNAKLKHELFAEVEGQPEARGFFASRSRGSRGSFSSYRGSNTTGSGHMSPRSPASSPPHSPASLSPMLSATASLSITRQEELSFPLVPSYEQSQADNAASRSESPSVKEDDWISGTHEVKRNVMVLHNPHPGGACSDLDERQSGFAPGLGVWDLKIFSDVFSIGGPIHARLTLPSLSPKLTIYSWRLLTKQTHTVKSPRDDPSVEPISSSKYFTTIERGQRPPKGVINPGIEYPAMYRGTEAGGEDVGEFMIEGHAVMPKDDRARPTTLPGLITPINVSHTFVYEVFFSVWGEDDSGKLMEQPGPGGLRFLQVQRPVILPSCALIPRVLNLPEYCQHQSDAPCPTCKLPPAEQLCRACPTTIIPHPRHDHPLKLVGNKDGVCGTCSSGITFQRDMSSAWDVCACGATVEEIEFRMGKFATEGVRTDFDAEAMARAKETAERGRARSRSVGRSRSRSRR